MGGRHAHRRRGSGAGAVTVPLGAVAGVVAVAVGAYVLMSATGPSGRSAQAATVSVEARHAVAMLERERQQMIAIAEASRSTEVLAAPKLASTAAPVPPAGTGGPDAPGAADAAVPRGAAGDWSSSAPVRALGPADPGTVRAAAENLLATFGWSADSYFGCLDNLWSRESEWRYDAANPSGAYGIPQALPGSKMASAGADWQTNPVTQISWGLSYIQARYGDPCAAWSYWQANGSY